MNLYRLKYLIIEPENLAIRHLTVLLFEKYRKRLNSYL
jgi:hypothetical protein